MPQAFSKGTSPTLNLHHSCPVEAKGSCVLGKVSDPKRTEAESGAVGLRQHGKVELSTHLLVWVRMVLGNEISAKPSNHGRDVGTSGN